GRSRLRRHHQTRGHAGAASRCARRHRRAAKPAVGAVCGRSGMSTSAELAPGLWADVDAYIDGLFVPPDPALDTALDASDAAGLPRIAISPSQGKLLHPLARLGGARRILEIGTLGGYSAIWPGRPLPPGGAVITPEA